MPPSLITPADIKRLRAEAHRRYGGDSLERGKIDDDCIDRSIGATINGAYYMSDGQELNILHIAAGILYYFVSNHCFIDGNKRTGWMAACDVLLREGIMINATDEEAETFTLGIAEGKISSLVDVIEWLGQESRLKSIH